MSACPGIGRERERRGEGGRKEEERQHGGIQAEAGRRGQGKWQAVRQERHVACCRRWNRREGERGRGRKSCLLLKPEAAPVWPSM